MTVDIVHGLGTARTEGEKGAGLEIAAAATEGTELDVGAGTGDEVLAETVLNDEVSANYDAARKG